MNKTIVFVTLFSIFLNACKQDGIHADILLKIGKLEISKYEYEKNKTTELINRSNIELEVNQNIEALNKWNQNFIDKCYIMADAYDKHYDTIASIQQRISAFGNYMMLKKDGYLWKETIAPFVEKEQKLNDEKTDKYRKIYHFEYIMANRNAIKRILKGETVITKHRFIELKDSLQINTSFQCGSMTMRWPFLSYGTYEDYLYHMKTGSVSQPLENEDHAAILLLTKKKDSELSQSDFDNLQQILTMRAENRMITQSVEEINTHCKAKYHDQNINMVSEYLENGHAFVNFKPNLKLMHYTLNNSEKTVDVQVLKKYYNQVVMRTDILDKESLLSNLYDLYSDHYLIDKANKLGLYETKEFRMDRKNYQNKVFYEHYLKKEIHPFITTDSTEIANYYHQNQQAFTEAQIVTFHLFVFKELSDAYAGLYKIKELVNNHVLDENNLSNLVENISNIEANNVMDMKKTGPFSTSIIHALRSTPKGSVYPVPFEYDNQFVVLYKVKEEGSHIIQLKDVYFEISKTIFEQKSEERRKEKIKQLKKKYTLESNLI